MLENYNSNPYYDDYNDDKNFHRMLFKPSFAVQARELTQIQTILQKQVERFGNHVFKNGSMVTGGQTVFQNCITLKINDEYSSSSVNISNFENKTIYSLDRTKRAEVIKVHDNDLGTGDPKTILCKQLYGGAFANSDVIVTEDGFFAQLQIADAVTNGLIFSVSEGVFYVNGFFVKNAKQTIAVSKYSSLGSAKIGFEIIESTVTASTDTSLLDPALGSSNYQAPGADRYKIELVLSSRDLNSTDTENFVQLAKIENGLLLESTETPMYAILEDQLARRTYDESGNYTVRPFQISLQTSQSNTAQTEIVVSPGKAYVFGYEYETKSPKIITVDKPRTKQSVQNEFLSADYGSYVFTKNHSNSFPIDTLNTIDVHCVNIASINVSTTSTISNTKIGTARVKTLEFDNASNTSDSQTYIFRTYLFDVNINNNITGTVVSSNSTHVVISSIGSPFTTIDDAYIGAKLKIVSGTASNESVKTISGFNAATQTISLSEQFVVPPDGTSVFTINFEFENAESLVSFNGTSLVSSCNIDDRSKNFASEFNDTILSESNLSTLLFDFGKQYVSNGVTDIVYSYRRLYTKNFGATSSGPLELNSGEFLTSASSEIEKIQNYQIFVVDNRNSAPYANGSVINPSSVTSVDTSLNQILVQNANNMLANIITTIGVSTSTSKTKSLITTNIQVQTTGGESILAGNVIVYANSTTSQTTILGSQIVKVPNLSQSLYVSDVIELVSVYDFNGNPVANTGYTDITNLYTLDNGQRDVFYDHASIKLKPGFSAPVGPLVVRYNRFDSADDGGYFNVDSYPSYDSITTYISPTTGKVTELRDCMDFRPVRKNATSSLGTSVEFKNGTSSNNPKIVRAGSDIIVDYEYYLPRIDKLVLTKERNFEVLQGIPAINPKEPKDKNNTMVLYILRNPAYVSDTKEIVISYIDNKRYTMRDIGNIDKRVQNLEYYTSLSLLEQETLNKNDLTILDTSNLSRFKNGILVDSFIGHSVADVSNEDYVAAIDPVQKEMRPAFKINSFDLKYNGNNSINCLQTGPLITIDAQSVEYIKQNVASKAININPFQVTRFVGQINLVPPTDIWVDTQRQPEVIVNIGGNQDAWDLLINRAGLTNWSTEWGSWETRWTGQTNTAQSNFWQGNDLVQRNTVSQQVGQIRTGTSTRVVTENITQSIGDRIVDVSVIPFMRERNLRFESYDFKANTTLYAFFDSKPVTQYCHRANEYILNSNTLNYSTETAEVCLIVNNDTNTSNTSVWATMVSNNVVYAVNTINDGTSLTAANLSLVGVTTGETHRIIGRNHYSGRVQAATNNTVTLRIDAVGANNVSSYVGSKITITTGVGAGQERTITNYNANTRVATINTNWETIPVTNQSTYGIGVLRTDISGRAVGIYSIPAETFRVGEKMFRLMDSQTGDLASSTTSGDASYFASGLLQTAEEVLVSTVQPVIQRTTTTQDRVQTNTVSINDRVIWTSPPDTGDGGGGGGGGGGGDPLAQTFFVSPLQFPNGVFVDKIRICFRTKDATETVTCQLRPTVNGYPHATMVYPYGSVSLTPDKVKLTESPNLDDPTKYTDFVFPSPVYMLPGEHSFILLTNSLKYEVYVSQMGQRDLNTNELISAQPYLGSLFLSQNARTWTAEQNEDLMFTIFKKEFSTDLARAEFKFETQIPETLQYSLSSDVSYDLVHLMTSEITTDNTSISYTFISEKENGDFTNEKPIVPLQNYEMTDGEGRRVLRQSSDDNTFVVRALMRTTNTSVSPVLDINRFGFLCVENYINNLPLREDDFVIENGGSGYSGNVSIAISAPDSFGATANGYAVVTSGAVTRIVLDNVGSGYTKSPTITVDAPGAGTTATVTYNGEDKKTGGNSAVRYLSRKVTLADGFDSAGDLRVYLTAYKPISSNIYVYYKILSKSDPEIFENKQWQLMTEIGNANFASVNRSDYRELTFAPGENGIPANQVSYNSDGSTYTSFKTFAIKIVISGTDSTNTPIIRDFRSIATPAGT